MYKCTACNAPCAGQVHDFGIGYGEAWGVTFYDSDPQFVSECCDAPVEDSSGRLYTYEDFRKDEEAAFLDYEDFRHDN